MEGREAADFAANTMSFVTAYGLALQGIGLSRISVNLAPVRGLRDKLWVAKNKWFIAAASIALIGSAAMYVSPILEQQYLDSGDITLVASAIKAGEQLQTQLKEADSVGEGGAIVLNAQRLVNDSRRIWPCIVNDAIESTLAAKPTIEITATDAATIAAIPAKERKRIVLENLAGEYKLDATTQKRTILVTMKIEFANSGKKTFLKDTIQKWLRDNSDRGDKVPYIILPESIALAGELSEFVMPGLAAAQISAGAKPDPSPPEVATVPATTPSAPPPRSSGGGRQHNETGGVSRDSAGGNQIAPPDSSTAESSNGNQSSTPSGEKVESGNTDLDRLAPIGNEPLVYGPGLTIYKGVIVFTVQIRDGSGENKPSEPVTP